MESGPIRSRLLTAVLLLACGPSHAAPDPEFDACVNELRTEALAAGIRHRTFNRAMRGVQPDASVIEAMETQPEFETPVWDYLARLVDEKRIAEGQARLAQWAPVLDRIEQQYGVDRHIVVAVWGVESDYGRIMGNRPLVRSLTTASCYGERQRFFRGELLATLQIIQGGDMKPEALRGSWAGAFGQTQFMPSTFQRMAVDFDGDGKRDLVASVPDALGSVANFLRVSHWTPGEPWGYEVKIPAAYDGPSGRHQREPLAAWRERGIVRVDGRPLEGEGDAALLLVAGTRGPAFLVFPNFDAIHAYNRSEAYALAIAHLADRLKGGGPIVAAWPVEDPILSRTERRELQQHLIDLGLLEGDADGIVGSRTTAAVKAFQAWNGMPPDGYASARVLKALREAPPGFTGPPAPPSVATLGEPVPPPATAGAAAVPQAASN
ncbi:MAG TPA: lytic murein transglycosylase [Usitatibacter sp.]|nr:lytic murein transglycosylase [Usitatibacter sp.]